MCPLVSADCLRWRKLLQADLLSSNRRALACRFLCRLYFLMNQSCSLIYAVLLATSLVLGSTSALAQGPVLIPPPPIPPPPGTALPEMPAVDLPKPSASPRSVAAPSSSGNAAPQCRVSMATCERTAPREGGTLLFSASLAGGRSCLVAALAEAGWLRTSVGAEGVTVAVDANPGPTPRRSRVFISSTQGGIECLVTQPAP